MSDENIKRIKELSRDELEDLAISMWDELSEGSEVSVKVEKLESDVKYFKGFTEYLTTINNELAEKNKKLVKKINVLIKAFNSVGDVWDKVLDSLNEETPEKINPRKEYLSPEWYKKREEVFEKYGKQCLECGKRENVQVHHLVYRKRKHVWEYDLDELIPLCKECHEKIHNDKNHQFHEKYLS